MQTPRIKHRGNAAVVALMVFAIVLFGREMVAVSAPLPECSDGIDNDDGIPPDPPEAGDGGIDAPVLDPLGFSYIGPGGYTYGDVYAPAPPGQPPTDMHCGFEDVQGGGILPCPLWITEISFPQNYNQCVTGDPAAAP